MHCLFGKQIVTFTCTYQRQSCDMWVDLWHAQSCIGLTHEMGLCQGVLALLWRPKSVIVSKKTKIMINGTVLSPSSTTSFIWETKVILRWRNFPAEVNLILHFTGILYSYSVFIFISTLFISTELQVWTEKFECKNGLQITPSSCYSYYWQEGGTMVPPILWQ